MSSLSKDYLTPALPIDRTRIHRGWWFFAAGLAIAVLPLILQDSYWRTNLIICAINVMLAIGLDFILGYAGQLNLGHSAFYGIGAYVSTLLVMQLGMPFWIAFLLGMVLAGAAGMALSIFAVRLRGHYLFCRHRSPDSAELDQRHAGAARHLRDQAAAADRCAGIARHRVRRLGQPVLLDRWFRVPLVRIARSAGSLADRRDADGDP